MYTFVDETNIYTQMKERDSRIETLKMLISSKEMSSQEELLKALSAEGFHITQATLSRDLKQLKVAKAATMNGKYIYVLPNETMYRRVPSPRIAGNDTILIVTRENCTREEIFQGLQEVIAKM